MNYEAWNFWWLAALTVGQLLWFGWSYLTSRDRVTNTRITELEDELKLDIDDAKTRLTTVEAQLDAVSLKRIHARIDEVANRVALIEGSLEAQTRVLNLVYQSLIREPRA